jgi:hypothetical protein
LPHRAIEKSDRETNRRSGDRFQKSYGILTLDERIFTPRRRQFPNDEYQSRVLALSIALREASDHGLINVAGN